MALTGLVHSGVLLLTMRVLLDSQSVLIYPPPLRGLRTTMGRYSATAMGVQLAGMNIGIDWRQYDRRIPGSPGSMSHLQFSGNGTQRNLS
jgi:hypothetical protein